jgi:hypothetical protein
MEFLSTVAMRRKVSTDMTDASPGVLHGVIRRENVRDEEENEQEIKSLIAQAQFTIAASS